MRTNLIEAPEIALPPGLLFIVEIDSTAAHLALALESIP
jgi:hypothetical protein